MRSPSVMKADELLDVIEQWAERLSCCRAATMIPMPAELHVQGQAHSIELTLREMVAVLKHCKREVPIDCEDDEGTRN